MSTEKTYAPPQELLAAYANVLVNYALNSGEGVRRGEVVQCMVPDVAKPLGLALQNTLLEAGAHPLIRLLPTGFDADYYQLANTEQLTFFPEEYLKERVSLLDHQIGIIADPNPRELEKVNPRDIIMARDAKRAYREWLVEKENRGDFTWTLALWGVEAKAKEVGLTLEEYWQQIVRACFLDESDPIAKWRSVAAEQQAVIAWLNELDIEHLHFEGADMDLLVGLGKMRKWVGGSGRNIPSFEIFSSPDWRSVEGWIRFNQPVYRYGSVMRGVRLEFVKGRVHKATADEGQSLLIELIKSRNADKAGEISLTDKRFSRITHVMAETLYDENMGGKEGNMHLAVGMAYKDCFSGQASLVTPEEWEEMGFNESAEHTDFVSTSKRRVTAKLCSGKELLIYSDGSFLR